jgi:hypothetical protein
MKTQPLRFGFQTAKVQKKRHTHKTGMPHLTKFIALSAN